MIANCDHCGFPTTQKIDPNHPYQIAWCFQCIKDNRDALVALGLVGVDIRTATSAISFGLRENIERLRTIPEMNAYAEPYPRGWAKSCRD